MPVQVVADLAKQVELRRRSHSVVGSQHILEEGVEFEQLWGLVAYSYQGEEGRLFGRAFGSTQLWVAAG